MMECWGESQSQRGGIALAVKAHKLELGSLDPFPNYCILDLFYDLG